MHFAISASVRKSRKAQNLLENASSHCGAWYILHGMQRVWDGMALLDVTRQLRAKTGNRVKKRKKRRKSTMGRAWAGAGLISMDEVGLVGITSQLCLCPHLCDWSLSKTTAGD